MKDLYTENHETLKKLKKTQISERYAVFMDCKNNIIKMSLPHKAIYRLNATPIKIPKAFFKETEQSENLYKIPKTLNNKQSNFEKKEQNQRHQAI